MFRAASNIRPVVEEEVHVLLFEPAETLKTGNVQNDLTGEALEQVSRQAAPRAMFHTAQQFIDLDDRIAAINISSCISP